MTKTIHFALLLGAILLAETASAASMRCGGHQIESGGRHGDGKYEVLKKCGEPKAREGNTWIYVFGTTRYIVHFNDSGLISTITVRRD